MNSTSGSHAVARELGLSVPGLHEAARSLSIATTPGGHLRFAPGDVATLVERVGRVPLIGGLTRTQVQVLTALSRHPSGLISQRAVARAAHVSPATAAKALAKLKADGLAGQVVVRLFDGQVSDRTVWKANLRSPQWSRIAPHLGRVVLPSHQSEQVEVPTRLPQRLARVFWTGDWREVNPWRNVSVVSVPSSGARGSSSPMPLRTRSWNRPRTAGASRWPASGTSWP